MAIPVPRRPPGYPSPGGPPATAVQLEFFADVQCPYCKRAWETMKKVLDHYKGRIKFTFTPYALVGHQQAFDAHRALDVVSRMVGPQAAYEFIDVLYSKQSEFSNPQFKTKTPLDLLRMLGDWARPFGVDPLLLPDLMDDDLTYDSVKASQRRGVFLGVWSTPTFFLNGGLVTKVTGTDDVSAWVTYLETFDIS
ncbi:Na(+)/H(+) antiporter NhaA 2 [Diplonema papillatum]|nr:Na(+)/H(+) antiporter NhaA 2 [Diplonema papillatum]|eukprot:gene12070-18646_t